MNGLVGGPLLVGGLGPGPPGPPLNLALVCRRTLWPHGAWLPRLTMSPTAYCAMVLRKIGAQCPCHE